MPGGARVIAIRLARPATAVSKFERWGGHGEMVEGVRRWWDPANRTYGGYELRLQRLTNGQFEMVVRGLGQPVPGYRKVEPVSLPAPRVMSVGDEFEVELARRDGARLLDRVRVEK